VEEVIASSNLSIGSAVSDAIDRSAECYSGLVDGVLFSIFGVVPSTLLGRTASPWLLSTVDSKPKYLLKFTKPVLQHWLTVWDCLENYVDARYAASLRWAKWAGFDVEAPIPYGPQGLPFCHIVIRK
jgi:hypothetical protein